MNEENNTPTYDEQGNVITENPITLKVYEPVVTTEDEPKVDTSKDGSKVDAKVLDKIRREEAEKWSSKVKEAEAREKLASDNYIALQKEKAELETNFQTELSAKETTLSAKIADLEKEKELANEALNSYKVQSEIGEFKNSLASQLEPEFKDLLAGETKENLQASFDSLKKAQDALVEKYGVQPVPEPKPKEKLQEKSLGLKDIGAMTQAQYNAYATAQIAKGKSPLAMLPN